MNHSSRFTFHVSRAGYAKSSESYILCYQDTDFQFDGFVRFQ